MRSCPRSPEPVREWRGQGVRLCRRLTREQKRGAFLPCKTADPGSGSSVRWAGGLQTSFAAELALQVTAHLRPDAFVSRQSCLGGAGQEAVTAAMGRLTGPALHGPPVEDLPLVSGSEARGHGLAVRVGCNPASEHENPESGAWRVI